MFTTIRLTSASFIVFLTLIPGLSLGASDQSLEKAIKTYKSGYDACVEAHRIRGSDLKAAKEKIAFYSKKLKEAKSIDSRIMSTTEQNIDRNIAQCKTAEEDILRAEAFPIIEKAFDECNKTKKQLSNGQISSAESSFKKYSSFKSQAFALTTSIDKQTDTKAKIKRCDKTGEKLKVALAEVKTTVKAAEKQNKTAQQALKSCRKGQSLLKGTSVSKQSLSSAKSKLSESKKTSTGINFNIDQAAASSKYGVLPIHKTTQASINDAKKCQSSLQSSIAKNDKIFSDQLAAKTAAAAKAQEQQLLKKQADKELADKKLAEELRLEKEKADKAKQQAQLIEQEKKRKEALAKADLIKKEKAEEEARAKALKAEEKARKKAERKNSKSDWTTLRGDEESDSSESKEASSTKKDKKGWTDLAPVNK